jgi:hypothetical protein
MIGTQPRVHAVQVAVTDDKDNVLGPVRIFCGRNSYKYTAILKWRLQTFQESG